MLQRLCIAFGLAAFLVGHAVADEGHPIGDAIEDVPIFDAHMHYKEPAWGPYPPGTVIELMNTSGVAMALVSSTPDDGTVILYEFAPDRIVPELRPYHGSAGSGNWTKADGILDYLKDRLARYSHEGIGEFHIHAVDPSDQELLTNISGLAITRNIPLHIHSGAAPVRAMYEYEPNLTIIWAHAGMSEPPETVDEMFKTYPTLYADTSFREADILTNWERWHPVLVRHADRLMIGTDTWVNGQWDRYEDLIATNRQWLSRLPRAVAEKIAFRNAAHLFNREITARP